MHDAYMLYKIIVCELELNWQGGMGNTIPTWVQVSWQMLLEPLSVKTSAIQIQACTGYHPINEGKYLEVSPDVLLKKRKIVYKSIGSYHLYKHIDDMIVKNIVSLNHNICTKAINNITLPMLYINNLARCLTYNTHTKAFITICISLHLIYYRHQNLNYNILSGALNKWYILVL